MAKKIILAVIAVFVVWEVLDFLIHNVMLGSAYAQTMELWRPEGEMKMGLMVIVALISAICFVLIYAWFVSNKNPMTGLKFGLMFGLITGISMGYGSYSVMPIPYFMAFSWFLGSLVEMGLAGWVTGMIVKEETAPAA